MKSPTSCTACKGTGRIYVDMGRYTARCTVCLGTGEKKPKRCGVCKGAGYVSGTCENCGGLGVIR